MGSRKRSSRTYERGQRRDNHLGIGDTLSRLRELEPQEPNEDSNSAPSENGRDGIADDGWEIVESKRSKKKQKTDHTGNYPAIAHSPQARLQTKVRISDLQSLALYLIADGTAPQWVSVRHHHSVRKVVVLMVPGLESDMFSGKLPLSSPDTKNEHKSNDAKLKGNASGATEDTKAERAEQQRMHLSPDDYYPVALQSDKLPLPLKPLASIFSHLWPVKTPGDDKYHRMHSPLHAMLISPLPKSKEEKKRKGPGPPRESKSWENQRTTIIEYLLSLDELEENEYAIHPALATTATAKEELLARRRAEKRSVEDGWIDSKIDKLEDGDIPEDQIEKGSVTAGRTVLAMDCEMCITEGSNFELTRISLIAWDGSVILDELVKPEHPVTDYLTVYSGITKEMLDPVSTTLSEIQVRLLDILTPQAILIGHSLNSDMDALKMTHPFIVDTSLLYPHPRGPPLKSSLKWLSQKYLQRDIQNHGAAGHNSIEDARACLDLVKQKCEKGPKWGSSDASGESIFKRLGRSPLPGSQRVNAGVQGFRTGAVVDWGDPRRGHGAQATVCIGCESDAEVVEGIKKAVNGELTDENAPSEGVDFAWGRLRELEAMRGWWNRAKSLDNAELLASAQQSTPTATQSQDGQLDTSALAEAVTKTVGYVADIYGALPPCTAFIVYSGSGDPRENARLQALHQQFRKEYATKKWDQLSVKWDDSCEQALRRACRNAREGIGFVVVK